MAVPPFNPEPYYTPTAATVDDRVFLRYPERGMVVEVVAEDGAVFVVHDGDGWKGPFSSLDEANEFKESLS